MRFCWSKEWIEPIFCGNDSKILLYFVLNPEYSFNSYVTEFISLNDSIECCYYIQNLKIIDIIWEIRII